MESVIEWLDMRIKDSLTSGVKSIDVEIRTLQRILKYMLEVRAEKNRLSDILDSL